MKFFLEAFFGDRLLSSIDWKFFMSRIFGWKDLPQSPSQEQEISDFWREEVQQYAIISTDVLDSLTSERNNSARSARGITEY